LRGIPTVYIGGLAVAVNPALPRDQVFGPSVFTSVYGRSAVSTTGSGLCASVLASQH
jgi:hypothetical protein